MYLLPDSMCFELVGTDEKKIDDFLRAHPEGRYSYHDYGVDERGVESGQRQERER